MSEKPEPGSIPAELVGHDAETADLLGSLSEGLAPDEDPLYVNLARRDAEKPPPRPMHEAEAPVYVDPKTPPERTKTKTLELETVRVDEPTADDPRRMPTQREIAVPRDALESEERRAPTQRKLRKPPTPEMVGTSEALSPPLRKSNMAAWITAGVIVAAIVVTAVLVARKPTGEVITESPTTIPTNVTTAPRSAEPARIPNTAPTTSAVLPTATTSEPRKVTAPETSRPSVSSSPVSTPPTAPPPTRAPGAVSLDPKVPF